MRVASLSLVALLLLLPAAASAQTPGQIPDQPAAPGSSSSTGASTTVHESPHPGPRARTAQPGAGGASITLDSSEALFTIAAGLNACGYDDDLANADPVRIAIRAELNAAADATPAAVASRDALCGYLHEHELSAKNRQIAQYVSLALYVSAPPALEPIVDQTEMPPDALAVINVLADLRRFAEALQLHSIWLKHRAEYNTITDRLHEPVTAMILGTNAYLKVPVSSYDGRRLEIFVEPLLAANAPNARIYATDYVLVTAPNAAGAVRMDEIRHIYLHYEIEPLVYARANSMLRLTPLLKPVQSAPLEYIYKTDVVALVTECLIKAIEARTMDLGFPVPTKPTRPRARAEAARYDEERASYDRRAEAVRRAQVALSMRQGWVLVDYFYNQLGQMEHNPEGLTESIGPMVYGMDVDRERHRVESIAFLPETSGDLVRRAPRTLTGLQLAERKILENDLNGAEELANKALEDPRADHAEALYVKAQVELMDGDPESSSAHLETVLKTARTPHTLAWAHVYLGRLYDIRQPAERKRAVGEYRLALAVPGVPVDARAAAEGGLKQAFVVPQITHVEEAPLDPSGKAEKEAYRPEDSK